MAISIEPQPMFWRYSCERRQIVTKPVSIRDTIRIGETSLDRTCPPRILSHDTTRHDTPRHERVAASYDSRLLSSHLNAWYSPAAITTAKRERKRATLLSFSKTIYGVLRGNGSLPRFLKYTRPSLTMLQDVTLRVV